MTSKVFSTDPRGALPESSFKYGPLKHLRTTFIRFVQGLFHASPRGAYHWEPEPEDSEIFIADESPINVEVLNYRPAISFTRTAVQFSTLGLDDMLGFDPRTGKKTKSVLVPGMMNINCCSRNDLESEHLAWIVAENLWLHREMLMREGFFEVGRQAVISAPSAAGALVMNDSADEWVVTSVTCPFQIYRTSSVTPLGEYVLQEIDTHIRTGTSIANNGGYPFANSPLPFQVEGSMPPHFSDASDVNGGTPNPLGERTELPVIPHPLNPEQQVTVRRVYPIPTPPRGR